MTRLRLKSHPFHLFPDSVLHIYWSVTPGKFLVTVTCLNKGLWLCQMVPVYGSHHVNHHPPRNPYGLPDETSKQVEPSEREKESKKKESCHLISHRRGQGINKSKSPLTVNRYTPLYCPVFFYNLHTSTTLHTTRRKHETPKWSPQLARMCTYTTNPPSFTEYWGHG